MRPELITHKNPKSPNSEIFRTLRTNIQFMDTKKKLKTLLVTSTFPAEGKSWVASNLAVTFAQAGKKVVLVDADMRKGRLYRIFEVSPKPGMSNYLSEAEIDDNGNSNVDIASYIQETEIPNLYIIPAGNVPPNPSELLVSTQMMKLLEDLKKICDLIVIDGTPCELVTDSIILSRLVDSTLIVAGYKITKKDALDRVIKNIQNVGGTIAGVVLNKMAMPSAKRYNNQYYYYGDHHKKKSETNNLKTNIPKKPRVDTNELENNISELCKDMNYTEIMTYKKEHNEEAKQSTNQEEKNTVQESYYNDQHSTTQESFSSEPQNTTQEVYNNEPQNTTQEVYNNEPQNTTQEVYNNEPQNTWAETYNTSYTSYTETTNNVQEPEPQNKEAQNNSEKDIMAKTNEIMKQINDYLNEEKKKLL